jgi:1-acyl-sn-glycerol-3-phosphate acyltransferase
MVGLRKRPRRLGVDEDPISYLLWQLNRLYCRTFHHFVWRNSHPIPREGGAILVCNHRSSVDPFILSATTRRIISFLVAEEFYRIPLCCSLFRWMGCIQVRRDQKDVAAVRKALKALEEGRLLCIFPEGGIGRGLENAHLGVGYLSLRSGAPVIPAHVEGTPESASVWKSLLRPSRPTIQFGVPYYPPPPPQSRLDRELVSQITAQIIAAIETLSP